MNLLKQVYQVISLNHLWDDYTHYYEVLYTSTDYEDTCKMLDSFAHGILNARDWRIEEQTNTLIHLKSNKEDKEIILSIATNNVK